MFNFESFLVEKNTQVELLPKDFEKLGLDMSKISSAMFIKADTGTVLGLSNVRLE